MQELNFSLPLHFLSFGSPGEYVPIKWGIGPRERKNEIKGIGEANTRKKIKKKLKVSKGKKTVLKDNHISNCIKNTCSQPFWNWCEDWRTTEWEIVFFKSWKGFSISSTSSFYGQQSWDSKQLSPTFLADIFSLLLLRSPCGKSWMHIIKKEWGLPC